MAIETEMFRLLFLCHERVNLMELYTREKELLIMFGSERRLDTHKRLQNAIPYMTDSLYKVAATALWNKLYNLSLIHISRQCSMQMHITMRR